MPRRILVTVSLFLALGTSVPAELRSQNRPLVIPSGPVCSTETQVEWVRIRDAQLGGSVTHATLPQPSRDGKAKTWVRRYLRVVGGWYASLADTAVTACGRVLQDQRFYSDWAWLTKEHDWNLYIVPEPGFRDVLAQRYPPPLRCDGLKDRPDDDCVETEVMPHRLMRDSLQLRPRFNGSTVCVYGVHSRDGSHGGKPEIHPAFAIWDRPIDGPATVHRLHLTQDASGRFEDSRHFAAPQPDVPWTSSPLTVQWDIPVRFHQDSSTIVHIERSLQHNAYEGFGGGQGSRPVSMDGSVVGRVEFGPEDLHESIGVALDMCRLDAEQAIGYLQIRTGVRGAEVDDAGFIVLHVGIGDDAAIQQSLTSLRSAQDAPGPSLRLIPNSLRAGPGGEYLATLAAAPVPGLVSSASLTDGTEISVSAVPGDPSMVLLDDVPVVADGPGAEAVSVVLQGPNALSTSMRVPSLELEVATLGIRAEVGEADPDAWPGFLDAAALDGFEPPDEIAVLHRIAEWRYETAGGFKPVRTADPVPPLGFELGHAVNELRQPYLTEGGWSEQWQGLVEAQASGWSSSFERTVMLLRPPPADGVSVLDLSALPGFKASGWGPVASHAIRVVPLEAQDDESTTAVLLDRLGAAILGPVGTDLGVQATSQDVPMLGRTTGTDPVTARARALRNVVEVTLEDGLLTLAEVRELVTLVRWWGDLAARPVG